MRRLRPLLARAIFALLVVAALAAAWRVESLRRTPDPLRTDEREQLRLFARRVAATTEPGAVIAFEVHEEFRDEGYVFHRLQHLIPGRRAVIEREGARYLARFAIDEPPGPEWRLRWRRGDGSVWERAQ